MTETREEVLTADEVIAGLEWRIQMAGGQRPMAEKLGISPGLLSDVMNRRRGISEDLARKLGFERRVQFFRRVA